MTAPWVKGATRNLKGQGWDGSIKELEGVILIVLREVDPCGLGKWRWKAVTKMANIRFIRKRAGGATPNSFSSCTPC